MKLKLVIRLVDTFKFCHELNNLLVILNGSKSWQFFPTEQSRVWFLLSYCVVGPAKGGLQALCSCLPKWLCPSKDNSSSLHLELGEEDAGED